MALVACTLVLHPVSAIVYTLRGIKTQQIVPFQFVKNSYFKFLQSSVATLFK